MPRVRYPPCGLSIRFDPPSLQEESGPDASAGQRFENGIGDTGARGPIRMFRIERQRDARPGYFSTPVRTIPRVNVRWKTKNSTTGIKRVMIVPACTYAGFV
jgi:hypothetical protein